MKWWAITGIGLLILPYLVFASISGVSYDDFYPGSNCAYDSFSCGSATDAIIDETGTFVLNLTPDDLVSTFVCAVFVNDTSADARTCIYRNGFSNTSCDSFSTVNLGNHSEYYECPYANLSLCGWNGGGGIGEFGLVTPAQVYQIDTSNASTYEVIVVSYVCNATPNSSFVSEPIFFRVANQKTTVCSGLGVASAVTDYTGVSVLGGPISCSSGSFCDPALMTNFSMTASVNGSFCTPGCHDAAKNGGETDIDYGGAICGNCSPLGRSSDEFYEFARELQESDLGVLSTTNQFNDSIYCPVGKDVGGASITSFFIVLLFSGFVLLFLLLVIIGGSSFFLFIVGRFIKKRLRGK